jgi:hypothetical protein
MPRDSGNEFGSVIVNRGHTAPSGRQFGRAIYQLLKCGGCGRGALATIYCDAAVHEGDLVDFFPFAQETAPLPAAAPDDITKEFREAELCAAVGANRAASALFRSALEKTLSANGYCSGNLKSLIDTAAGDGLITESRRARAHEDVRALGNDVLHEAWQAITREQVSLAHRFAQRIIEDFYDDRPTAEKVLLAKGRITS